MANNQQFEVLKQGRDAWNQWRIENASVTVDLSGIEVSPSYFAAECLNPDGRLDWRNLNLRGANLNHAQFSGVDMTGADCNGADLQYVTFSSSNLDHVMFDGADLSHGKFWDGYAPGASFWDAVLEETVLSGAQLDGANFTNSNMVHVNLEGANLSNAELWRANLQNANLGGATLFKANMTEIDLSQANLHRCDLKGANLYAANLSEAMLDEADVRYADLRRANFSSANVTEIQYNKQSLYRGIRVSSSYGSPRFTRLANDQNYIEELRAKTWDPFVKRRKKCADNGKNFKLYEPIPVGEWQYWLWFLSSDCGRSMLRWTGMALLFSFLFAVAFYSLGEEAFAFNNRDGQRLSWSLETMMYYSISLFAKVTTVQVTPVSFAAEMLVTLAGIAGLITIGGLATILADKVARRA
jgi:uncharacterized protein YjbI with pentapeptide repeats